MSITSSDRAVVPESVESNELVELAEAVVAEAAQADGVVTEASDEAAEASDASDAEPALTFGSLGLADSIVRKLAQNGVTTPFPIQAATIPDALAGKDILGRGRTGSGKTLAFGLPLLTELSGGTTERKKRIW